MIGSIVGGALGAAGSIFGGISSSRAMRRMKAQIEDERRKNRDWYNRRYNEAATQRADAQHVLTRTQDALRERSRSARGQQAVMGGTEASVAATKSANAQAMADAASRIVADGEHRKDDIEEKYMGRDGGYASQLGQIEANRAQAIAQAVGGVAQAGAGIAGAF